MIKFKEIEVKFNASDIKLSDFIQFCADKRYTSTEYCCGYDHFYSNPSNPAQSIRHRVGPNFNQLTFKEKTEENNNYIRTENNISLLPTTTKDDIEGLCTSLGYKYNTTIFKNIWIYAFDDHVMSYYVVYTADMKELGRFVEIEMSEDRAWISEEAAWSVLRDIEELAKPLGITPQGRIKKSLFEQFRR